MIAYTRGQINRSIDNACDYGINDKTMDALIDLLHDNKHRNIFYSDELSIREEDFIKHFK